MPSQLLNLRSLAARLPDTTLLQRFNRAYITTAIKDQQDAIVQWLGYDPLLDVRYGEGDIQLVTEGDYVGNYRLETETWPLLNDTTSAIFPGIFFTYPNTYLPSVGITPDHIRASVQTGEVYIPLVLASGAYLGGDIATVSATGWNGTYVAGYGTGINDPSPSGGGTGFSATLTIAGGGISGYTNLIGGSGFKNTPVMVITGNGQSAGIVPVIQGGSIVDLTIVNPGVGYSAAMVAVSTAPAYKTFPAPPSLQRACALLVQEQLQLADPANSLSSIPIPQGSGMISQIRTRTQAISFRPTAVNPSAARNNAAVLGAGTPLSTQAMQILVRFKKGRQIFMM